ncbi:MAG: hypothetical protein ACWA6U_13565 [Breznakibacter sp.]
MNQISTIYQQFKTPKPMENFWDYRPVVKISFQDFCLRLKENGDNILKMRGVNRSFEFYEQDKPIIQQLFLYATCHEKCEYPLNKGLVFMGNNGTGKSILMESFIDVFNNDRVSKKVRKMDAIGLVNLVCNDINILHDLKFRPLFIDDIGKEPFESKSYGTPVFPFRDLIATRYGKGGVNFFTSNHQLKSLHEKYGNFIGDRLKEMCTFIPMIGESRRI